MTLLDFARAIAKMRGIPTEGINDPVYDQLVDALTEINFDDYGYEDIALALLGQFIITPRR